MGYSVSIERNTNILFGYVPGVVQQQSRVAATARSIDVRAQSRSFQTFMQLDLAVTLLL